MHGEVVIGPSSVPVNSSDRHVSLLLSLLALEALQLDLVLLALKAPQLVLLSNI